MLRGQIKVVLIVSDDADRCERLGAALAQRGRTVRCFSDSQRVVSTLETSEAHLLIVDFASSSEGAELLSRAEQFRLATLLILGCGCASGRQPPDTRNSYIARPFSFDTLRERVAQVLEEYQ